jgi:RNA-directed DNA polymerase
MSQSGKTRYECDNINWRKLERNVFKLQKRIYKASKSGNLKKVRSLQRLLIKSKSAKLLAVRRVAQVNKGKKTAGIDGVKSLTSTQRLKLAQGLQLEGTSTPMRRVWIPKSGKAEKRPLGIPTMTDRAKQALVKLALEPECEARFEPNSYGFRPARSCQDAQRAIHIAISLKRQNA